LDVIYDELSIYFDFICSSLLGFIVFIFFYFFIFFFFCFQAEDGIRDRNVTGVQTCALPILTSKALRQAVQAALDMEPIMRAGFGHKDFFRLDPGLFFPEQPWHSTVSAALYNQHDKDKPRRLLMEASYARQPLRWSSTPEYEIRYKTALVAKQQYEDVGTVKLGDYFTLDVARRELRGDFRTAPRMYFWNTWLAK